MSNKTRFPNISSQSWEHPADRAALTALHQIPGLDMLLKMFMSVTTEKALRLMALSSSVRVGPRQFPQVHKLLLEACNVLDITEPPEVFVAQNPQMNAAIIGVDKPFILLNSSLVKSADEEELLAVIAHELGHYLSGHVLYKTLLYLLLNTTLALFKLPVTEIALAGIIAALREWDRKSELSSDRAELLVTQNINPSTTLLMKLAGGPEVEQMNLEEFYRQAADYDEGGDIIDSFHKFFNGLYQTHPFAVIRLKELKMWYDSGDYLKILNGEYVTRDQDKKRDFAGDVKNASDAYQAEMKGSKDPLMKKLNEVGEGLEKAGRDIGRQAEDFFKGILGK